MKTLYTYRTSRWVILTVAALLLLSWRSIPMTQAQENEDAPVVLLGVNQENSTPLTFQEVFNQTGIGFFTGIRTGRGVRIGVIDGAFGDLLSFEQETGKVVAIPGGQAGDATKDQYSNNTNTHGTDVLRIINQIAPDATLYACWYFDDAASEGQDSFARFQRCIDYMISQPVDIVNHSAGVPVLPLDGTNAWAVAVDEVLAADIAWVNSAGNFSSGYISDIFRDANGDGLHEFNIELTYPYLLRFEVTPNYVGNIILSWQSRSGDPVDLDIDIIDPDFGDVILTADRTQTIETSAGSFFEQIYLNVNDPALNGLNQIAIQVRRKGSNTPLQDFVDMVLFVERSALPGSVVQGSVVAPADNPNVLTVGALQANGVAPYSSRGTLRNDVTVPDIVAPGEIIVQGDRAFTGTSAAAPVVTGALALLKEVFPDLAGADLVQYLLDNATLDDNTTGVPTTPGKDTTWGEGALVLPDLPSGINIPTPQPICEIEFFANTNIRSGPGTGFADVGTALANSRRRVVGRADGSDAFVWYFLGNGEWVRANTGDNFGDCFSIPVYNADGTPATGAQIDAAECPGAPRRVLEVGDIAQLSIAGPIRVLNEPGGGTTYYLVYEGGIVTVTDGPRCSLLFNNEPGRWWLVDSPNGPPGWVAEGDRDGAYWEVID